MSKYFIVWGDKLNPDMKQRTPVDIASREPKASFIIERIFEELDKVTNSTYKKVIYEIYKL